MNSVQEILKRLTVDKACDAGHSYGDFYADLFERIGRDKEINILELGVQNGGSLCAWQQSFPLAHVYGVDIVDVREDGHKATHRSCGITFYQEDLKTAIDKFKDIKFDLIIDDSDHSCETAVWVTRNYFGLLKPEGVIVIEDIQEPTRYVTAIKEALPVEAIMGYLDLTKVKGRHDDFIVTITPKTGAHLCLSNP